MLQRLCFENQLRCFYVHRHTECGCEQRFWPVLVSEVPWSLSMRKTNVANHSHRYRDNQGTLFYNPATLNGQAVYAAAYMIQSSPSMICPYFNDTISYRSSTGLAYYVVCGGQYNNGIDISGGGSTSSKLSELTCHQLVSYFRRAC